MRNDRGYTYLLTNGREYKIGITTGTPVKRVAELQTGSPTKISISAYCYNGNALAMEMELHTKFSNKRLEGEWFALDDDDVAIIHHHFETNHLDEYFAPLSARAVEIKRQEVEREAERKRQWKLDAPKREAERKKEEAERKRQEEKREAKEAKRKKEEKENKEKRKFEENRKKREAQVKRNEARIKRNKEQEKYTLNGFKGLQKRAKEISKED